MVEYACRNFRPNRKLVSIDGDDRRAFTDQEFYRPYFSIFA